MPSKPSQKQRVIVLGAKGRLGRAAVDAFLDVGWSVSALGRSWNRVDRRENLELVEGDAFKADTLSRAAMGCDVIVNALNPPYPRWADDLPRFTTNVIATAKASGATVVIPGNVYNFGEAMPARLTEDSPQSPTTCKGRLRVEMELAYANASADGVRTIIVRAGDYIEREKTGNWFDGTIAGKIETGNVVYPGPMNAVHAWAYLPDLGRVMAALADRRGEFEDFEAFGFPGFALTGTALVASMEEASGGDLKVKGLPWPIIRLLGVFKPMMREIAEMSYLWHTPHAIDGAKLAAALPDFRPTPLKAVMADALSSSRPS